MELRGSDKRADTRQGRRSLAFCARATSGFTLIELLVTLAVAAILTVVAVPSFKTLAYSNRLTTTANEFVEVFYAARTEAIRRNGSTQLCGDNAAGANGSANDDAGGDDSGKKPEKPKKTKKDPPKNGGSTSNDDLAAACNATADSLSMPGAVYGLTSNGGHLLHDGVSNLDNGLQISGSMSALRFTSDGVGHAVGDTAPFVGQLVDICTNAISTDNHRTIDVITGSVITVSKPFTGSCP